MGGYPGRSFCPGNADENWVTPYQIKKRCTPSLCAPSPVRSIPTKATRSQAADHGARASHPAIHRHPSASRPPVSVPER